MLFLETICLRGDVPLPELLPADTFLPLVLALDIFLELLVLFAAAFLSVLAGLGLAKSSEDEDPTEEARTLLLLVLALALALPSILLPLLPLRPRSVASASESWPFSIDSFRFCVEPLALPTLRFDLLLPLAPAPRLFRSADDGALLSLDEPLLLLGLDRVRSILYVTLGSDLHRFGIVSLAMGAINKCVIFK